MENELIARGDVRAADVVRQVRVVVKVHGMSWMQWRLRAAQVLFRLAVLVGGFGGVEFAEIELPPIEYDHFDGHGRRAVP